MSSHADSFVCSGSSPTEPDFICENHGSVFLLRPLSPSAFEWVEEHLPDDSLIFGNATVIEPRYVFKIILAIQDAGLAVSRG